MLNKLTNLYTNAIVRSHCPDTKSQQTKYWFQDTETKTWIGIPKNEISLPELTLLETLFDQKKQASINQNVTAEIWHNFLFKDGYLPECSSQTIRMNQFYYSGEEVSAIEFETALMGFFSPKTIIVWVSVNKGLLIEPNVDYLSEEDFHFLITTLESEFLIKPYFYIGIHRPLEEEIRQFFKSEQDLFNQGRRLLSKERVFQLEKVFPYLLAEQIPIHLRDYVDRDLITVLANDPDILITIRVYLENNMNVTSTAKALYIHRNTLQYRLDKFTEKTGVNIKTFSGAITVYLACLILEIA